jgi:selenoprotein W-related protein
MLIHFTTIEVCDARDDDNSNAAGNIIIPNFNQQMNIMKPTVTIKYCPKCGWLLRAAYMAQELLTTFNEELKAITLQPSEVNGDFHITIDSKKIFDRSAYGGFPEIKELKQLVRDVAAPGKSLGHSDTKPHHQQ